MKVLVSILKNDPPTLDQKKYSNNFVSFVNACLVKDPKKRSTAEELLEHRFIQDAEDKFYIKSNLIKSFPPIEERKDPALISIGQEWLESWSIHWQENNKNKKKWIGFGSDEYDLHELKQALLDEESGKQQSTKDNKKPVS